MNEFISEFFASTTGEDQRNYFFGEVQLRTPPFLGKWATLVPGTFRVSDGALYQIASKPSSEEKLSPLYSNNETTSP